MNDKEKLAAWESIGARIWPYVRYFGLCGAELEAVQAVADLGVMLGHDKQETVDPEQINLAMLQVRNDTINEIGEAIAKSPEIIGGYGIAGTRALSEIVKKMGQA